MISSCIKKFLPGILIFFLIAGIAEGQYSLKGVEERIYCPCGCGNVLAECQCETAVAERAKISRELLSGKTPDEIISEYTAIYGSSILVNQEAESIKKASKETSMNLLPFYVMGLIVTGFVAYRLGKGSRKEESGEKRKKKEWEL